MGNWDKAEAQAADGTPLYIHTLGDAGAPPLLLLHGFSNDGRSWQSLAERLAERYWVIAPDARGHGFSGRVQADYDVQTLAADALAVLDALHISTAGLIGHSLGAATALLLAMQHPQRAAWIFLEDPALPEIGGPSRFALDEWRAKLAVQQQAPDAEVLAQYEDQYPGWHEADYQAFIAARNRLDLGVFTHFQWATALTSVELFGHQRVPGRLLYGDFTAGSVVPAALADLIRAHWRTGQLVHIAGGTHHLRCGRPAAFQQALDDFLAQPTP